MAIKTILITSGTTFTIPSDFGSLVSIEAIGAGGCGASTTAPQGQGGGGGGAYAKITSLSGLSANGTVYINIGAGGSNTRGSLGVAGGNTWLNTATSSAPSSTANGLLAPGGAGGTVTGTPAAGGLGGGAIGGATGIVGTTTYVGGNGGAG